MDDFVELLKRYIAAKGDERKIADEFSVSFGTLQRWKGGRSLPHSAIAEPICKKIKEELGLTL